MAELSSVRVSKKARGMLESMLKHTSQENPFRRVVAREIVDEAIFEKHQRMMGVRIDELGDRKRKKKTSFLL